MRVADEQVLHAGPMLAALGGVRLGEARSVALQFRGALLDRTGVPVHQFVGRGPRLRGVEFLAGDDDWLAGSSSIVTRYSTASTPTVVSP